MSVFPIINLIQQHAEESAILRNTRSRLIRAPHIRLPQLSRFDERLAAHLDGLAVAGEVGSKLCEAELETPGVGQVFAASVRAIEERDEKRLDRLYALVEALPDSLRGLTSAFGWVAADYLRGLVRALLDSDQPLRRSVGLAACAMHQVDPGPVLAAAVTDSDAGLRARALRTAGVCGCQGLISACQEAAVQDDDPSCRFWAGWSAVLLGDRGRALAQLAEYIHQPGPFRDTSMQIVLRAMDIQRGLDCLKRLAQDAAGKRELIRGAGIAGDPYYAEWLLGIMENPAFARLAGESFSSIMGVDFAHPDFNGKAPENFEAEPSDDPEDQNVDMDLTRIFPGRIIKRPLHGGRPIKIALLTVSPISTANRFASTIAGRYYMRVISGSAERRPCFCRCFSPERCCSIQAHRHGGSGISWRPSLCDGVIDRTLEDPPATFAYRKKQPRLFPSFFAVLRLDSPCSKGTISSSIRSQ